MYTREQIEAAVKSKGYVWFEDKANKGFDVNIVGVRNSSTGKKVTNVFDDTITLSYNSISPELNVTKNFLSLNYFFQYFLNRLIVLQKQHQY